VLELHHRRDQRALGQAFELRVFDGLAEDPGEGELLLGGELLVAKEDHQVLEQRRTQLGHRAGAERLREVDTVDLGAERAGNAANLHAANFTAPTSSRALRAGPRR
jgi:hypothetical protein